MNEEEVQNKARLEASKQGYLLFRNNTGVLKNAYGRPIRFGLCNDSAKLNQSVKSSDLVGIRRVLITEDMVGDYIGQFIAIECKHGNWKYTGTARERAQKKFMDIIANNGGYAFFYNGNETL